MEKNHKTVVILGAGRGQLPIYEICLNLGCKVVFVTPKGDYPGIGKAEVRYADVMDYETVYEIAQEVCADAVITDQLDAGVYSCAYASEKLGLIGIGTDVAKRFKNKHVMKKNAIKAGVAVPKFAAVKTQNEVKNLRNQINYPIVMKPSDNASSRGVYLVDNEEELLGYFDETKSYSSEGVVLLERFIKGTEFVVESFTKNYEVTDLIIGHTDYFELPKRFIPRGRVFKDVCVADSYIEKKVLEVNDKFIKYCGLPFGITHGEYIYNYEEDKVYLVEIAARGGGEFISGVLIPLASGIRANKMMVYHTLGYEYDIPKEHLGKSAAYFSYMLPEGTIISIDGIEKVRTIEGVYDAMFDNIKIGMRTPQIRDKSSRRGPLLVKGDTETDCYKVLEAIMNELDIKVKTDNGEVEGIIWDKVI